MKVTSKLFLCGLLAICVVALCLALTHHGTAMKPSIEQSIAKLRARDFQSSREGQLEIVAAGKSVLPQLWEQMRSSDDPQQIALVCYLIGELDSEAYRKALMEFGVKGRLCTVLRYPNLE